MSLYIAYALNKQAFDTFHLHLHQGRRPGPRPSSTARTRLPTPPQARAKPVIDAAASALSSSDPLSLTLNTIGAMASAVNQTFLQVESALFSLLFELIRTIQRAINDPWTPAEAWFIVAWHLSYRHVLKGLYIFARTVEQITTTRSFSSLSLAPYHEDDFRRSFFGFLMGPCKDLTWVYSVLWIFDMLVLEVKATVATKATSPAALPHVLLKGNTRLFAGFDEAVYTLWGMMLLIRLIERYVPRFTLTLETESPGSTDIIVRFSTLIIVLLGGTAILKIFGLTAGAIGLASVSGLAFSLASKDLVENLMGGIFILVRRPFKVGDTITTEDVDGRVRKIGWLTTEIITKTSSPLYVPNQNFISNVINNKSRNTHGFVEVTVPILCMDAGKVPLILRDISNYLKKWDKCDYPGKHVNGPRPQTSPRVGVTTIDHGGVHVTVQCSVGPCVGAATAYTFAARSELLQEVGSIVHANGARFGVDVEMAVDERTLRSVPFPQPALP